MAKKQTKKTKKPAKKSSVTIKVPSFKENPLGVAVAVLAAVADGVILGAKAKRTKIESILRNYKILNEVNARILGAILQW